MPNDREPRGHARWAAPLALALAVLAPWARVIAGRAIPIPDDFFVSDLVEGELPARVEAARLLAGGELPTWTPRIFTGTPLAALDPLSLALFSLFPPALALGLLLGLLFSAAALGTYALARHLGASRAGAFLSGFAFAWSGFFVCQLRHLGILETVALFPLALLCLEKAAAGGRRSLVWLAGFAALFGQQLLAGFPQSAYAAALAYGALVLARAVRLAWREKRPRDAMRLALGAAAAAGVGLLLGMPVLLPLRELGALSDRSGAGTLEWATHFAYWPKDAITFLFPYANGDVSNFTYDGPGLFWEDYGYVGFATALLAAGALLTRWRRFAAAFWGAAGVVAYLIVLGPATPVFPFLFRVLPGLSTFRFPTRFLFVVDLAIVLLAALGLTLLAERLGPAWRHVSTALVLLTAVELVLHNRRQNALADARAWLAEPASAREIGAEGGGRVFTPGGALQHRAMISASRGWSGDLSGFLAHRELLHPDANLLWGISTLDGYAGIAPRWTVDLVGDHNRRGLLQELHVLDGEGLRVSPRFFDWLEALSVRWLLLPFPLASERAQWVASAPPAEVHRIPGALPRARVAGRARIAASPDEVRRLAASSSFDPRREVLLTTPLAARIVAALPGSDEAGNARIVRDRATDVVVEASAPRGGLLVLADTFHPAWKVTVDGRPAPMLRANVAHRAVPLPPGGHRVEFRYRPRSVRWGLGLGAAGLVALAALAVTATRAR